MIAVSQLRPHHGQAGLMPDFDLLSGELPNPKGRLNRDCQWGVLSATSKVMLLYLVMMPIGRQVKLINELNSKFAYR